MKPFTTIAAAIFLLMAIVHAYRLAADFPIAIGSFAVGHGVSWIALTVTAILSAACCWKRGAERTWPRLIATCREK